MDDNNIIELGEINRSMTLKPKERQSLACRHRQTVVDQTRKMVQCTYCKQFFEPFEFIMMWATKETNLAYSVTALAHEQKNLIKEVEDLKRQKRNLKAQLNRLKK